MIKTLRNTDSIIHWNSNKQRILKSFSWPAISLQQVSIVLYPIIMTNRFISPFQTNHVPPTRHHEMFARLDKICICNKGRAIAQAVSRWLPTAATQVRARVWSCGIFGGRNGTGAGCLTVHRFPLSNFIPPTAPQSPSSIIRGWYNMPVVATVPSGLSLTPLSIIKKYICNYRALARFNYTVLRRNYSGYDLRLSGVKPYLVPESNLQLLLCQASPPMVSPSTVVVGFECSRGPEGYAGGSVATGRVTHAGPVKG
jgi:hypothetical protein